MDQRQLFLRDVLTVVFKRWRAIIGFALLVFVIVFVGNYVWPPTYESQAKVRIVEGREQLVAPATVTQSAAQFTMLQMTVEDVNSEVQLIYSDNVLAAVVDQLKLDQGPGVLEGGPLRAALRTAKGTFTELTYLLSLKQRPTPKQAAVETLRRAIDVRPVEKSYVLEVKVRYSDPETARKILEVLLLSYRLKHTEVFKQEGSQDFIKRQLDRVREELGIAQIALKEFSNENKVLEVDIEKELLLDQYSSVKRLIGQLEELGEVTEEVRGDGTQDMPIIATLSRETDSTVVTELRLKLLEKLQRRNELMQTLGPQHPERMAINKEIETAVRDLRGTLQMSMQKISAEKDQLETRLKDLNTLMQQYENLSSDVKIKSDAVQYYSEKLEEAIVADEYSLAGISSIKVVSEPSLPADPVSPRRLFNLLVAAIGGLVAGLALAFFLEYLDHGIKTPEDVEYYLKVPPLASFFRMSGEQLDPREAQRLSALLEAVHPDDSLQLIQVASPTPGEGSFRVARALAEASAEDPERRTLYVDFAGDGMAESPGGTGLMEVLSGQAQLADVVTSLGNLYVIGRGSQQECPTYLWHSERMRTLLAELRQRFDRVIFHVPPVLRAHDALNLARLSDGVLLVVRANSTRREVVLRAMEMLAESKGRLLGVVMTERTQAIPKLVYKWI